MTNQEKFARTMEMMVAGVMMFAGIVDLIGAFRGFSDLSYYSGTYFDHMIFSLIVDLIFAALFVAVGITIIINRSKHITDTKNNSYQFASIFGAYMVIAASIFMHLYNDVGVEIPSKITTLLVMGIIALGGGMGTKSLAKLGKCAPALISGGISGVCCIVSNSILMDMTGNTNTTYVAFIMASVAYLIYVFADNLVIERRSTNNNDYTGPVDATKYMNSKEHLPPQGKSYTPEEYYKHIGIKSKQDKSEDKEEK